MFVCKGCIYLRLCSCFTLPDLHTAFAGKALPAAAAKSTFSYGSLTNPTIANNGHTLMVTLPEGFKSDVKIPIRGEQLIQQC
jgi:hypothetical protein